MTCLFEIVWCVLKAISVSQEVNPSIPKLSWLTFQNDKSVIKSAVMNLLLLHVEKLILAKWTSGFQAPGNPSTDSGKAECFDIASWGYISLSLQWPISKRGQSSLGWGCPSVTSGASPEKSVPPTQRGQSCPKHPQVLWPRAGSQSFWVCLGCTGGGDFCCSLE